MRKEGSVVRKLGAMLLIVAFLSCAIPARAEDSECDCDCKKGGLGLMLAGFVVGFGVRSFNTVLGCDAGYGVGIGLGSDTHQMRIGGGYNQGIIGFGFTFKGPEKTRIVGLAIGYDYSDCRMVWPYEE